MFMHEVKAKTILKNAGINVNDTRLATPPEPYYALGGQRFHDIRLFIAAHLFDIYDYFLYDSSNKSLVTY